MKKAEFDELSKRLGSEWKSILTSPQVDIQTLLDKVINPLRKLDKKDRAKFQEFAKEISNEILKRGLNLRELDLNQFRTAPESIVAQKELETNHDIPKIGFDDILKQLIERAGKDLQTLKGYFLLKLENDASKAYKPLLLFDDNCFHTPIKKKMEPIPGFMAKSIVEFTKETNDGKWSSENFLCILLVSIEIGSSTSSEKGLIEYVNEFFKGFQHSSSFSIIDYTTRSIKESTDIDQFGLEIKYVTKTFLLNTEISNEEEEIIKKIFSSESSPILDYKILKGGKSGSKVIEIRPKKAFYSERSKRYIVKIAKIDAARKIQIESERYKKYLEGFETYSSEFATTFTHHAIKYVYASKDGVEDSSSFAKLLDDEENAFHSDPIKVVKNLFEDIPFSIWKESCENKKESVSKLYENYVNPEKIIQTIATILHKNPEEAKKELIVINFQKIFSFVFNTKIKVCHGDLHSENFFYDGSGVYLIDFGHTEMRHSVIDHTSLECSMKFRHIPRFIELKTLLEIEDFLLTPDSFLASKEIRTNRSDLSYIFSIIKAIRLDSTNYFDSSNILDYLISLYMMTFRQIGYADMNQYYAFRSCEKIGQKLVNDLGL